MESQLNDKMSPNQLTLKINIKHIFNRQVEFEYSFIDNPTVAPTVLKYFTTEAASGYKKALYCIVSLK